MTIKQNTLAERILELVKVDEGPSVKWDFGVYQGDLGQRLGPRAIDTALINCGVSERLYLTKELLKLWLDRKRGVEAGDIFGSDHYLSYGHFPLQATLTGSGRELTFWISKPEGRISYEHVDSCGGRFLLRVHGQSGIDIDPIPERSAKLEDERLAALSLQLYVKKLIRYISTDKPLELEEGCKLWVPPGVKPFW